MHQFDKNNFITFDKNDSKSIQSALLQYQTLLNNGKAFQDGLDGIFDVEFKQKTSDGIFRLQTKDTNNTDLLRTALSFGAEDNWPQKHITDDDAVYISEPIFFAIALEHCELQTDIVNTAEAIVKYMRKHNDTSAVWIDDMSLFGVEALYMLAYQYPQYTYLLAQFFIPYWDTEHAVGYEAFLSSLVAKNGWSKDLIKAYIWCDSAYFRYNMFALENGVPNKNLADHLKESPEDYEWFKQETINRFNIEPVLMCHSDDDIEECNPVVELFSSFYMPEEGYLEDEEIDAYRHAHFINSTLENEAFDLHELVLKNVDTPLAKYDDKALEEKEGEEYRDRDSHYGDDLANLEIFILALPNGADIWTYIDQDINQEILDNIQKTELIPIAKKHAKNFYFEMTFTTSPMDYEGTLNEELDSILTGVLGDLVYQFNDDEDENTTHVGGLVMRVTSRITSDSNDAVIDDNSAKKEEGTNKFLRVLDVFYRLLGKQEICHGLKEILTDEDDALITLDEFYKRYSVEGKAEEVKLSLADFYFESHYKNDKDTLRTVEAVIKQNGREAFDCAGWGERNLGRVTLAAYLFSQDNDSFINDTNTEKLIEYIGEGPWEIAFERLCKFLNTKTISSTDLNLIKDYFTCPPQNPFDLMMGNNTQHAPLADQKTILTLLEKHLHIEEVFRGDLTVNKYCEQQKGYSLFFYDDGFQNIILSSYWIRNIASPAGSIAKRIWALLIALAPQKVIRQVGRLFSDEYVRVHFEDNNREERFYEALERAKVPQEQLCAFEMAQKQNTHTITEPCVVDEYMNWINLYDEIDDEDAGMIGAYRKSRAIALDKGLSYINESARLKFFIDLALHNPRFPLQQDDDFKRCLDIFIKLNRFNNAPQNSEFIFEKTLAYVNGEIDYAEIKSVFELNISIDIDFALSRTTNYDLGKFIWQLPQEQQQRLFILLLNHSVRSFKILEDNVFESYLRHLVKNNELTIEEYLASSSEQYSDTIEGYIEDAYEFLYEHIQDLYIRKDYLIMFLIKKDIPFYKNVCVEMARNGVIEKNQEQLSDKQCITLINIFSDEEDAKALIMPFKSCKSRKVLAAANTILNN